jgi:alkanesulfonate monooxygenase SsuD/methylene tetrahydromethanopterin reductase-like flavin-dependent oxidoreductase (luciferase family)
MRFGLYAELQTPLDKPHAELYRELLAQMEHADAAGFDVYSVIEHHFFQEFSISANPLALISAAAQRTRRLRFRVALHTLPLCNPMRLAGEIAAADILTEGRLETGLGRGHAWLFERSGVELAESRERFEEAVEVLLRAWTEDTFSHQGRYYRFKDLTVVPKPPLLPFKVMQPSIDAYVAAAKQAGHEPNIVYIRPVYLGDRAGTIQSEVELYLHNFLAFNASPVKGLPPREELLAKGYGFYASGALESLTKLTFRDIVDQEIGFIGTPEQVIGQVRRLREQAPIAELAIVANFGGLEHWKVLKTQELFARHVIPAFRGTR